MNKKQKKMLTRIIISSVLMIVLKVIGGIISIPNIVMFILYMVPYVLIGYDILKKALKGILNRQVFDENGHKNFAEKFGDFLLTYVL